MSSSNMCATKANKQSLGFLTGILHTMSHVSTDLNKRLISGSLSAFISKILHPRVSHRQPLFSNSLVPRNPSSFFPFTSTTHTFLTDKVALHRNNKKESLPQRLLHILIHVFRTQNVDVRD